MIKKQLSMRRRSRRRRSRIIEEMEIARLLDASPGIKQKIERGLGLIKEESIPDEDLFLEIGLDLPDLPESAKGLFDAPKSQKAPTVQKAPAVQKMPEESKKPVVPIDQEKDLCDELEALGDEASLGDDVLLAEKELSRPTGKESSIELCKVTTKASIKARQTDMIKNTRRKSNYTEFDKKGFFSPNRIRTIRRVNKEQFKYYTTLKKLVVEIDELYEPGKKLGVARKEILIKDGLIQEKLREFKKVILRHYDKYRKDPARGQFVDSLVSDYERLENLSAALVLRCRFEKILNRTYKAIDSQLMKVALRKSCVIL